MGRDPSDALHPRLPGRRDDRVLVHGRQPRGGGQPVATGGDASSRPPQLRRWAGIQLTDYHAIIPATIVGWDARSLRAEVSVGLPGELRADPQETALERRYALRQVKARLHQTLFRAAVLAAYGGRCALSGLPETSLLDAAHIAADGDELLGQPVITNGLPLTKLHHAAFDNHLIGINPDCRIVVSRQLLDTRDGPTLEALKSLDGNMLIAPRRLKDRPDRERLAMRFEQFEKAN